VRAERVALQTMGTDLVVRTPVGTVETRLALPGRFNVYNALAAIAVGASQGLSAETMAGALGRASGVPGRMQRVDCGQPFTVIVDYAHTGASFEKVLNTLKPLTSGRLIAVFGCAGERGTERRTGMGEGAAKLADYTVVTSEDPRSEDPAAIIADIAGAMVAAGAREGRDFERVEDRRDAIRRAFELARSGDVVLLTGKGHEHSIQVAGRSIPWDEVAVARELLAEGADGLEML
jgi:UDP-N-acetylmuramoyl-L-alanyl-D-glutamate--2,6-diaminopimelate ligase